MIIRAINSEDLAPWYEMRNLLWPDEIKRNKLEAEEFFGGTSRLSEVLLADMDGKLVGFIELSIRDYAKGSSNFSIPYVDAWFVKSEYRGEHVGSLLMSEAEKWASCKGFDELASDTELENKASTQKHKALGFKEAGRTIHLIKRLS